MMMRSASVVWPFTTIAETIAIDLPRPRSRQTLREPRFAELRERVWDTLMSEARKAEFQL